MFLLSGQHNNNMASGCSSPAPTFSLGNFLTMTPDSTPMYLPQDPFDDYFDPVSTEMDNVEVSVSSNPDEGLQAMVAAYKTNLH